MKNSRQKRGENSNEGIQRGTVNADKYPATKLRSFDAFMEKKERERRKRAVHSHWVFARGRNIARERTSSTCGRPRETFSLPRCPRDLQFSFHTAL